MVFYNQRQAPSSSDDRLADRRYGTRKGSNLTGVDPATGDIVRLYHPRDHTWDEHFRQVGARIVGLTAIGRTTVRVLNMNEDRRVRLRMMLRRYGQ